MVRLKLCTIVFFAVSTAFAQVIPAPEIRQGSTLAGETRARSLAGVLPGTIIVLGEDHGTHVHQAYQLMVMEQLRAQGLAVSVGMEFLDAPSQDFVDQYRAGRLSESDFLSAVKWSGFPFEFYREQILFPNAPENTIGLNVPRSVTSHISKNGVASLTTEELDLLPKNFLLDGRGNDLYFQRFKEVMSGHISDPTKLENYFMAQSAWDDTMAWHATDYLSAHPNEVLVIVVGDFHAQYGGGLPDRLKKRGAQVVTVSMLNTNGMTEVEKQLAINPASIHGPRADWIWLADF